MQITVRVKQVGRKRALIEDRAIEIEEIGPRPTLEALIRAVVAQQVAEYNAKPAEKNLLPFLSSAEIEDRRAGGKIGFGAVYSENKADPAAARETAVQAFADGMFGVFAGDEEIRALDAHVPLDDDTVITFIRLTFLAGSYW